MTKPKAKSKTKKPNSELADMSRETLRETIQADIKRYRAAGKKVETIPTGETGWQPPMGGKRSIVIGRHRQQKKQTELVVMG